MKSNMGENDEGVSIELAKNIKETTEAWLLLRRWADALSGRPPGCRVA